MTDAVARLSLPWVDDLCQLPAEYIRHEMHPLDQGLTLAELATALSGHPRTREYLLAEADPVLAEGLRRAVPARDPDAVLAAEVHLMAVYFWQVVYHCYAEEYETFSASQRIPYGCLFPAGLITDRAVLDLAAGTCAEVSYLTAHARSVLAVDPARSMLEIGRRKFGALRGLDFAFGSFARIPLPDASVDVIVSCYGYQASEERGGRRGIAEMRRVLRPGGRILLAVDSRSTVKFWTDLGWPAAVAPEPVVWRRPAECSRMLSHMFDIAGVHFGESGMFSGTHLAVLTLAA
jgi:SAM-dependent methyltransferase